MIDQLTAGGVAQGWAGVWNAALTSRKIYSLIWFLAPHQSYVSIATGSCDVQRMLVAIVGLFRVPTTRKLSKILAVSNVQLYFTN